MNEAHKRYVTNGSNALEAEVTEFDIYVKPVFPSTKDTQIDCALIIDFEDALEGACRATSTPRVQKSYRTPHMRTKSGFACLADRVKNNKILADLFHENASRMNTQNRYRKDDLITFAKGFTVTGVAAFLLVVFGI